MADDVNVQFGATVQGLLSGLNQVTAALGGLTGPINAIVGHAKEAAEVIAAAFGVEKIAQFVERMGELGEKTERTAAMLGITTEYVGRLQAISKLTGTDVDSAALALERMQVNLQHAQDPMSNAGKALSALGLTAKDLIGLPLPQQLDILADRVSRFADGGNKTAIVMALLGRGGAQMIPILDQGSKGLEELGHMADRTGTALTELQTRGMKGTHDKTVELGLSFQGVAISIFGLFKPAIDGVVSALTAAVQSFNNALKGSGLLRLAFQGLAVGAQAVASAIVVAIAAIEALWTATKETLALIAGSFIALGRIIAAAMSGDLPAVKAAWADLTAGLGVGLKRGGEDMLSTARGMLAQLKQIWGAGVADAAHEAAKAQAPALNIVDKDGVKAAIKTIDGELAVLKQGFEQKKILIEADYAQHQITEDSKFALLQRESEREYGIEQTALQRKLAIANLDKSQRQDILNQIALIEAKHRTDMLKLDEQSIAARQRVFTQFGSAIQSAWDNQLRGLITGQTSWAQAFKNITLDLTLEFIKFAEKTVIEWVAAQAAKLTATQSGAVANAAAEVAGREAALPAKIAAFTSDITAAAGIAFANAYAALAAFPPAAAASGAAASGIVLSQLVNVPKFETGAWRIPRTMPAILHPGERVLNAKEAAQSRGESGSGGGGDTYHLSFLDGSQAMDFVERHAGGIAHAVAGYQKRNPSARGAW